MPGDGDVGYSHCNINFLLISLNVQIVSSASEDKARDGEYRTFFIHVILVRPGG